MKPITYVLELCDTSGAHCAIATFTASMPFPTVTLGERFDDTGWDRLDTHDRATAEQPRMYTVHSVKHLLTEDDGCILHRYQLNLTPYAGPRSPVWG